MRCFTHYWNTTTFQLGVRHPPLRREQLDYVAGNGPALQAIGQGDAVYAINFHDRRLYLIGRLLVDRVTDEAGARARLGPHSLYSATTYVIGQKGQSTPKHFDICIPESECWERIRFMSEGASIPPARNHQTYHKTREITPLTASFFNERLGIR